MSLYAEYLIERTNDKIIETDFGFVTYRHWDNNEIFVADIFVKQNYRKAHLGSKLLGKIIAAHSPRMLVATIVPAAKGATEALKAALNYGFVLYSSTNDFIIIKKILKED